MYSRNYVCGDNSAKITPPPAYSGSAIQGKETGGKEAMAEEPQTAHSGFGSFSQSIPFPKSTEEHKAPEQEKPQGCPTPSCAPAPKKEKCSFLSGILNGIGAEDLILIGIIAALAFDLADRDILLVALVVAVVLM
jgi:hypothetical protein